MKNIFIIIFFLSFSSMFAQIEYPIISKFDVENTKTASNHVSYQFLMLNSQKAIDLRDYGNKYCEFKIIGSNQNRAILEYNQPSKLNSTNGWCAAGAEKGILVFEFDTNDNLLDEKYYLLESCLLGIETIVQKKIGTEILEYTCENLGSENTYILKVDLKNSIVTRKNKD